MIDQNGGHVPARRCEIPYALWSEEKVQNGTVHNKKIGVASKTVCSKIAMEGKKAHCLFYKNQPYALLPFKTANFSSAGISSLLNSFIARFCKGSLRASIRNHLVYLFRSRGYPVNIFSLCTESSL